MFVDTVHGPCYEWSVNFAGGSAVSLQLSTEPEYLDFPSRAVAADLHGILLRVASLEDSLHGKVRAWSDPARRQSKRIKDLADIARLTETHPRLWASLYAASELLAQRPVALPRWDGVCRARIRTHFWQRV